MKQRNSFFQKLLTLLSYAFQQSRESCSVTGQEYEFHYVSKKRRLKLKIKKTIGGKQNGKNELAQSKI